MRMSFRGWLACVALITSLLTAGACGDSGSPAQGGGAIGEACTADTDCATGTFCKTDDPGGQCLKNCTAPSDCPAGSICNSEGRCYAACTSDADCRTSDGYSCMGTAPDQICDVP
jgi:Cys-rich repeat protein